MQRLKAQPSTKKAPERGSAEAEDPYVRRARQVLERALGTEVAVRLKGSEKGEIRVRFHDAEDFDRLIGLMTGESASER